MIFADEPGVVIVGASLAGLTCAQSLRAEGYTKKITLIGAEKHLPYNRPPLSKQVLSGKWQGSQTAIDSSEKFAELALEFSLGESAIGLDVSSREVKTNTRTLAFEDLIIATGASVRRLASTENMSRVHVLRTLDDALGLRDALTEVKSAVVVGAGVLGSEVISALSDFGIKATVIDRMPAPQLPLTGGHFASRINDLFLEHNVLTKYGVEIVAVREHESGITFELSDGSSVTGDIAVVAIGCIPTVEWLANSGLDITNGVLCDSNGVAAPHIYAAGDVSGKLPLSSVASMQGRKIAEHVMGLHTRDHRHLDYDKAASAIFTEPEIADVGLAEADAFASGRKIRVTKVPFSTTAKALINNDSRGFVKIISDPATGEVLGGSIVGRHAAELISVIALAVTANLKVTDIEESLLVHPALAEALADAAE
jgi:dihydrolipoamide dehydrogenase